jgi:ABC-type multidrug transport system ATPase subunit
VETFAGDKASSTANPPRVLELIDLSLQVCSGIDDQYLLAEVGAQFPRRHFAAILGPSGCGKSTLLKVIAGVREHSTGKVKWDGRSLGEEGDLDPHEIGYVPQFSIAFELLTVWENLEAAFRLRVAGIGREQTDDRIEKVLTDVGLLDIADREVRLLSGGQRRRLALALEMVSSPHLLLCDEVTSGLDPKAEDEIVKLMREISRSGDRIVLNVTHSLRHLKLHDSVIVLYEGHVAYHGAPTTLLHYFGVEEPEELFPRLAARKGGDWHRSWLKYRNAYYAECGLTGGNSAAGPDEPMESTDDEEAKERLKRLFEKVEDEAPEPPPAASETEPPARVEAVATPSPFTQFAVILSRRWTLFFRDRGQLGLQLALLFGFPLLVIVFALHGLPQLPSPSGTDSQGFIAQMLADVATRKKFVDAGTLVSGLVMFQVILLALMGSNNSAREIAGERLIFEKEKFAGLSPGAYVLSKAVFLGVLVVTQSVWMTFFVNFFVKFPGSFAAQALLLVLVNGAMTAVCLGLSSVLKTPEQSSLVSIYLVGFQLPLSGALLALPPVLATLTRPFIASYWSWSGFLDTMRDTRLFDAAKLITATPFNSAALCVWFLLSHVVVGLLIAYTGCKSSRWE